MASVLAGAGVQWPSSWPQISGVLDGVLHGVLVGTIMSLQVLGAVWLPTVLITSGAFVARRKLHRDSTPVMIDMSKMFGGPLDFSGERPKHEPEY